MTMEKLLGKTAHLSIVTAYVSSVVCPIEFAPFLLKPFAVSPAEMRGIWRLGMPTGECQNGKKNAITKVKGMRSCSFKTGRQNMLATVATVLFSLLLLLLFPLGSMILTFKRGPTFSV